MANNPGRERSTLRNLWARIWDSVEGNGSSRTSYYLIVSSTVALTFIGVVMVLSASSVENIGDQGSYSTLIRQGVFALLGFGMMFGLSFLKPQTYRKLSWLLLVLAFCLLALVFTPLGTEVQGNRNWFRVFGLSFQPSEAAKLALCIWGAHVLTLKNQLVYHFWHAVIPVVLPGAVLLVGMVLLGRDLGTAIVMLLIVFTILFAAGMRTRYLASGATLGLILVIVISMTSDNRMRRIRAWIGDCDDGSGTCYQYDQGILALASGGWWGAGLGQSRQKWSYIPEAENDFIFTVLGEELGLLGAGLVIVLFVVLAIGMYRVAHRAESRFVQICTLGIMSWLVGQAFMNIAMVTGLLPVVGVPLPFISSGGSALMLVLAAVGVVLSFAREERRLLLESDSTEDDRTDDRPENPNDEKETVSTR